MKIRFKFVFSPSLFWIFFVRWRILLRLGRQLWHGTLGLGKCKKILNLTNRMKNDCSFKLQFYLALQATSHWSVLFPHLAKICHFWVLPKILHCLWKTMFSFPSFRKQRKCSNITMLLCISLDFVTISDQKRVKPEHTENYNYDNDNNLS